MDAAKAGAVGRKPQGWKLAELSGRKQWPQSTEAWLGRLHGYSFCSRPLIVPPTEGNQRLELMKSCLLIGLERWNSYNPVGRSNILQTLMFSGPKGANDLQIQSTAKNKMHSGNTDQQTFLLVYRQCFQVTVIPSLQSGMKLDVRSFVASGKKSVRPGRTQQGAPDPLTLSLS